MNTPKTIRSFATISPTAARPISSRASRLFAAVLAGFACVAAANAAIVSDSFSNADGTNLHGAETGSLPAWVAAANVAIDENGRVTTTNNNSAEFTLPVPNETGGLLTLKADVSLGESGGDWIGLSFLASTGTNFFDANNTLSVILRTTGYVTLFKNNAGSSNIGHWQYPGTFNRAATYTLELRYDRTAQTADVFVNGTRLNSAPVAITGLTSNSFRAVGVRIHGAMVEPTVDNFLYRTPDCKIADSFNLPEDTTLNGVVVGKRPAWVAAGNVHIDANGRVTTTNSGSVEFKLPVPNEVDGRLVLKADLRAGTPEWTGLFFGATPASDYNDPNNPLLLILRSSGWVILFKQGATTQLAAWKPFQSLDLSRFHAVEFHYDRDAGTVDVFLDGSRLNENPVSVGNLTNSRFGAVGVRFHGSSITAGGPAADNFLYRTPDFEIADSFNLPGGTTLNGVVADTRPAWRVDGAAAVFANGVATTAATGASEFKLPVSNLASGRLALSADVRLGENTSWAGISLLASATPASGATSSFFNTQNPLLLIMRRGGQITLYKNGTSQSLGSSTIPAFSASDFRLLELGYDRDAGTVDVLVNGEPLAGLTAVQVGALNNPAFGAVGVRFHADSGVTIAAGAPALNHFIHAPDPVARGIPAALSHRPGNVFLRGDSVVIPAIPGHTGAWTVRNIDGASVASGSSAGGIALGDQYPVGHYRVFFGSALAATFAVIEPLLAPVPDDSPVCLHTQFTNRYILGNIGDIGDAASLAALAGVNGIRDATAWTWQWDDQNGQWLEGGTAAADSFDLLRLATRQSGLDLLTMIEPGTPPSKVVPADWGTRINKKFPADLRDYHGFVRHVATRAGGRVSAWEGWNEPEGIGGMHLGSEIASAMKIFALALRSTGSDALATMGLGHAPVESLHRNGYLDAIDLYNYHNHSSDADWVAKREALDPYTGSRPVWVSEASYGSYAAVTGGTELTADAEREQARDIPKIYARGIHDGHERVYYFTLVQVSEIVGQQWGVLRAGTLQPRSGYLALAAAGRLLAGARPAGALQNLPVGLEGWSFTSRPDGAHKGVLVLWSESGATVSWAPPTGAALFDLWGRSLPPATSISIGRDPVWCVLPLSTLQPIARDPVLARPAFSRPAPGDLCPVVADFRTADRFKNNHSGGCFLFTQTESELDIDVYNFSDTSLSGAWTASPLTGFTVEVVTQPGTIAAGGVGTLRVKLRRPAASWSAAAEVRWLTLTGAYGSQGESLLSIPFRQCPAEATPTTWRSVSGVSNPAKWGSSLSSGTTATTSFIAAGGWTRFDITFGPPPNTTIGLAWAAPYYVLAASEKPQTGAWGVGLDFRTQAVPHGTSIALNLVSSTGAWNCPLPYDMAQAASGAGTRLLLPLNWFARIAHRSSSGTPETPPAGEIVRLEIEVIGAGGATVKIDVADIAWASGTLQ